MAGRVNLKRRWAPRQVLTTIVILNRQANRQHQVKRQVTLDRGRRPFPPCTLRFFRSIILPQMNGDQAVTAEQNSLLRRARARASGADVHRVDTLCAAYLLFLNLLKAGESVRRECDQLESALLSYIHTGRLPAPEWTFTTSNGSIAIPLIPFGKGTAKDVFAESRRLREQSRDLRERCRGSEKGCKAEKDRARGIWKTKGPGKG